MNNLLTTALRALEAWDTTVLPKARDGMMHERMEDLRAATAEPQPEPVAIPDGWGFNHAQAADDGLWDVGHLNEDDYFSAVIRVDTGNYFMPEDAEPIARAILALLRRAQP